MRVSKSLSLAWLIRQAKLELNIKLKLELKSSFLAWDPKKIASSNAYITKNQVNIYIIIIIIIIYSFYHSSNTRDRKLFKLQFYIIKSIHHHSLSIAWVIVQNTIFTSTFVIRATIIFTNLNKLTFQNIYE